MPAEEQYRGLPLHELPAADALRIVEEAFETDPKFVLANTKRGERLPCAVAHPDSTVANRSLDYFIPKLDYQEPFLHSYHLSDYQDVVVSEVAKGLYHSDDLVEQRAFVLLRSYVEHSWLVSPGGKASSALAEYARERAGDRTKELAELLAGDTYSGENLTDRLTAQGIPRQPGEYDQSYRKRAFPEMCLDEQYPIRRREAFEMLCRNNKDYLFFAHPPAVVRLLSDLPPADREELEAIAGLMSGGYDPVPIRYLELPVEITQALQEDGVADSKTLLRKSPKELLEISGIGPKALDKITGALSEWNLYVHGFFHHPDLERELKL